MSTNAFSSEDSFDGMDMDYDSPDLMTSEFFDSVLSLENNMEETDHDGLLSNLMLHHDTEDPNVSSDSSSHTDEVFSPQSSNSECENNKDFLTSAPDPFDDPFLLSLLEGSEPEPPQEPLVVETKKQTATKLLIQNPHNKKMISKPMIAHPTKQALKGKPQFLKVNQITGKGGSVILPLNMKSIKILKAPATIKLTRNDINSNVVSSSTYPPLVLTNEEKRLLIKEGIQLPTHHPLTKNEERELKRIRRKIRNKISAQDSRKRKKEYVDGLEERVKRGSEDNKNLLQRVRALQRQNRTLIAHVNKLQALIKNSTASKATPSTCLMVVLLSALFVSLPNINLFEGKQIATEQEQVAIRRSLLSSPAEENHNNVNMEEFLIFKDDDKLKPEEVAFDLDNKTEAELNKMLEEMEKEYEGLVTHNNNNSKMGLFGKFLESFKYFVQNPDSFNGADYGGGYVGRRGFLEPEIDEDEEPPSKRNKRSPVDDGGDHHHHHQATVVTTVTAQMVKDK